jgi:hypothetical protein
MIRSRCDADMIYTKILNFTCLNITITHMSDFQDWDDAHATGRTVQGITEYGSQDNPVCCISIIGHKHGNKHACIHINMYVCTRVNDHTTPLRVTVR